MRSDNDVCDVIKYSDDAAVVARLHSADSFQCYVSTVSRLTDWCTENFLHLSVGKTKEMCFDFRKSGHFDGSLYINGEPVEVVDSFKYLGVHIDNKLSFSTHVQSVNKECQQRLYLLRKMKLFDVDSKLLLFLYRSIVESVLTFCAVCFYPALTTANKNTLLKNPEIGQQNHW